MSDSKKRSATNVHTFFDDDDVDEPEIPDDPSRHPHDNIEKYKKNPPIPIFNYTISNTTFQIIEDNTGKP